MTFFLVGYDSAQMRTLVFTLGQAVPLALTLKLLLSRPNGQINPGARLAAVVTVLMLSMFARTRAQDLG